MSRSVLGVPCVHLKMKHGGNVILFHQPGVENLNYNLVLRWL